MHSLSSIMPSIKVKKPDKTMQWQSLALEAIAKFNDGQKYKASIFKCYKQDSHTATHALNDTIELNKPYALYFLKCYTSIRTRTNAPRQREEVPDNLC